MIAEESKKPKNSNKNLVINNKQILKSYGGFCPTGQYSFPFSFQIPYWLPPSFVYSENEQLQFSVYYALEAYLLEDLTAKVAEHVTTKLAQTTIDPNSRLSNNRKTKTIKDLDPE